MANTMTPAPPKKVAQEGLDTARQHLKDALSTPEYFPQKELGIRAAGFVDAFQALHFLHNPQLGDFRDTVDAAAAISVEVAEVTGIPAPCVTDIQQRIGDHQIGKHDEEPEPHSLSMAVGTTLLEVVSGEEI